MNAHFYQTNPIKVTITVLITICKSIIIVFFLKKKNYTAKWAGWVEK